MISRSSVRLVFASIRAKVALFALVGSRLVEQFASAAHAMFTNLRLKGSERSYVAAFGNITSDISEGAWSPCAHGWTSSTMCYAGSRRRIAPVTEQDGLIYKFRAPLDVNMYLMDTVVEIWTPDWELQVNFGAQWHASMD